MKTISIQGTKTEGDNLFVTGTVDGTQVTGHGWVSRFNKLPSDQRKINYLEELLEKASPLGNTDQILIQKYLRVALHKRVWKWTSNKFEHVAVSSVVFVVGLVARHYILLHLAQIEQFLHVNLSFIK